MLQARHHRAAALLPLLGLLVASAAWAQAPDVAGVSPTGQGAIGGALVLAIERVISYWRSRDERASVQAEKRAAEQRHEAAGEARAAIHRRLDTIDQEQVRQSERLEVALKANADLAGDLAEVTRTATDLAMRVAVLADREDRRG